MVCSPWDFACQAGQQVGQSIINQITPYILPIVLFLLAIFVFPRIGKKGWVLSVITLVGLVLWFFGIPGFIQPLNRMFLIPMISIGAYRRSKKQFYIRAAVRPVGRIKSDVIEADNKAEAKKLFMEKFGYRSPGPGVDNPANIIQVNERK